MVSICTMSLMLRKALITLPTLVVKCTDHHMYITCEESTAKCFENRGRKDNAEDIAVLFFSSDQLSSFFIYHQNKYFIESCDFGQ